MAWLRVLLLACLWLPVASQGAIGVYQFESPEMEDRFERLTGELRCPKCQNQNIAASNAPIAEDMRDQVYHRLQAGQTDDEIIASMVERFGDFVHYRPPMTGAGFLLWFGPVVLGLLGLAVILLIVRRSRRSTALSADERSRLDALLAETEQDNARSDSDR